MTITHKKLWQGQTTNVSTVVYTVPANTTTLLTRIDLYDFAVGDTGVFVHIVPAGGSASTANIIYARDLESNENFIFEFEKPVPLHAGESIAIESFTSGINVRISGTEVA